MKFNKVIDWFTKRFYKSKPVEKKADNLAEWILVEDGELKFKREKIIQSQRYATLVIAFNDFYEEQKCIDSIDADLWSRVGPYERSELFEWLHSLMFRPKANNEVEPYIKLSITLSAFVYGFSLPVALLSDKLCYNLAVGVHCSMRKMRVDIERLRLGQYCIFEDTTQDEFNIIDSSYHAICRILADYNGSQPPALERLIILIKGRRDARQLLFTNNPHTLGVGLTLVAALAGIHIPRQWIRFTKSSADYLVSHIALDSSIVNYLDQVKKSTAGM